MRNFHSEFKMLDVSIRNSYQEFGLKYLFDFEIDGKKSLTFFTQQLGDKIPLTEFNSFQFFNELSFISDDIIYFTALTFLLKPYINNPLRENKTYFQRFEDKRYMSFANILFQTFYNYWDRIGDLLYKYFMTGLQERNVYLHTVLDNVDESIKNSNYYLKLKQLYDKELKVFFKKRKEIVHYLQLSSEIYSGTFLNYGDHNKISKMQTYKEGLPEFFKTNIEYTLLGFEYAVKLIGQEANKIKN